MDEQELGQTLTNTLHTMRVYVGGLVALAAVAGCGTSSGAGPRTLPPVTASPSPVSAASPTSTGKDAPTPEGAAAFARFFYAEISRAFEQRDPSIVQALVLPTCKTCKLYIDSITQIRDRRETFRGGGFHINFAVAPADTGSGATARVDVGLDFGAGNFYDASGKLLSREPARRDIEEEVALSRVQEGWRVATVKRVVKK